jgi:hypothetical protein
MRVLAMLSVLLMTVAAIAADAPKAAPEAPKAEAPTAKAVTFPLLYRAGDRLLLVYTSEIITTVTGGGVTRELIIDKSGKPQGRIVKVDPAPGSMAQFATLELPLVVTAGAKPGEMQVAMTARRAIQGTRLASTDDEIRQSLLIEYELQGRKPTPQEFAADFKKLKEAQAGETVDTADPKPAKPEEATRLKESLAMIDFAATLADNRFVAGLVPRGKPLQDFQKIQDPKQRALREAELCGRFQSMLENTQAYLPLDTVTTGQTWKIERKRVIPVTMFEVSMAVGSYVLMEKSECRLDAVRETPQGKVAVIKVKGRRDVAPPAGSEPALPPGMGGFFDTTGEIQVNVNSGVLVSLRLENKFTRKEGELSIEAVFVDTATLTPLGK